MIPSHRGPVSPPPRGAPFRATPPASEPRTHQVVAPEHDVVDDGEVGEQPDVLEGPGHAHRAMASGRSPRMDARETIDPPLWLVDAAEAVEDRRLAGAVGADDGEELAVVDGEADPVRAPTPPNERSTSSTAVRRTPAASAPAAGRSSAGTAAGSPHVQPALLAPVALHLGDASRGVPSRADAEVELPDVLVGEQLAPPPVHDDLARSP